MTSEIVLEFGDGVSVTFHYALRTKKPEVFEMYITDPLLEETGEERNALIGRDETKALIHFLQGFLDVSE